MFRKKEAQDKIALADKIEQAEKESNKLKCFNFETNGSSDQHFMAFAKDVQIETSLGSWLYGFFYNILDISLFSPWMSVFISSLSIFDHTSRSTKTKSYATNFPHKPQLAKTL